MALSGSTGDSARMMQSIIRLHCEKRAEAAVGKIGLKMVPFGAVTLIGRNEPSLAGIGTEAVKVSSSSERKAT